VLRKTLILVAAACLALAPAASGAQRDSWAQEGPKWATVNVCAPGSVGVRASLPGDGGGGQMAARFTLQWLNPATQAWEPVQGIPTSHWIDAGPASVLWSQVGYTFDLDPIPSGTRFTLRGIAELKLAGGRAETLTAGGSCTLGG
jgi:hypothetical protein